MPDFQHMLEDKVINISSLVQQYFPTSMQYYVYNYSVGLFLFVIAILCISQESLRKNGRKLVLSYISLIILVCYYYAEIYSTNGIPSDISSYVELYEYTKYILYKLNIGLIVSVFSILNFTYLTKENISSTSFFSIGKHKSSREYICILLVVVILLSTVHIFDCIYQIAHNAPAPSINYYE